MMLSSTQLIYMFSVLSALLFSIFLHMNAVKSWTAAWLMGNIFGVVVAFVVHFAHF
jgi:uncharacterized membrane protein